MKTPASPTRPLPASRDIQPAATLQPWGSQPALQLSEPTLAPARGGLKARVAEDHPEGKARARARYFDLQRGLPTGHDSASLKARARAAPTPVAAVRRGGSAPAPAASFRAATQLPLWRELGPTLVPHGQTYGSGSGANPSVSGRCTGLVVDRSDPRHLVLCSASGGLWGSPDAGATWAPLTDQQPTLVMGGIAQSASAPQVMYAATGDGDGSVPYGIGLLRSSDGGRSWTHVPNAALTGIGVFDIAVAPQDALEVWIASTAGVHVSSDGGQTVRRALASWCWSVSVNPANPLEVLAGCETGLMRSNDGGASWSRVALPGTSAATRFDRLEVCHAPSQPDIVFANGCAGGRALLWRRASAAGAFAAEAAPGGIDMGQAWYDWCLAVSPHDANLVCWGAIELYRGRRGASGMTWAKISSRSNGDSIHPDQHGAVFDPRDARALYAINDGGVFRSPDLGASWQSLNPGLGITEFEFLAQLESDPAWLMGGTQDNGTLANGGLRRWDQIALGDGGDCAAVDRGKASICYHSYYDMPVERAACQGPDAFGWVEVSPPVPNGYPALFYPPLEARGHMLAKAGASVWVSVDDGDSWAEVALPTSNDDGPDLASALAIVSETRIIVGTVGGRLYRLTRGAPGWGAATVLALGAPGNGYVSDIAVSGASGATLWVSCSRLGGGHVFRSTNGGKAWTDRTSTLPDMAVNALVVDPKNSKLLYAGTDRGVWRSTNSGGAWSAFNNGLPNVIVGDLLLHSASRVLRAGTRARGAWELSL